MSETKYSQKTKMEIHKPYPPAGSPSVSETFPSRFARYFFGVLALIIFYYSYLIIKPFLVEIFLALVLFIISKPLNHFFLRLFPGWRNLSSGVTCLVLGIVIVIPLLTLASIIAAQALEIYNQISQGMQTGILWESLTAKFIALENYIKNNWQIDLKLSYPQLEELIRSALVNASQFIYNSAIGMVKGFTNVILSLLLIFFITFFCFIEGDEFIRSLKSLSPLDPSHNEEILGDVESTVKATIRGTVIVALIQGFLGGFGFFIFGVPSAAFWGTLMVPASVLPVVGAAIIWIPGVLFLIFKGKTLAGLGLLFWGTVVIGSIDNLLKPYLMKGARYTPTIFSFFAIIGGIAYFGTIGFILGPLILSFMLSVLAIYQKTILKRELSFQTLEGEFPREEHRSTADSE